MEATTLAEKLKRLKASRLKASQSKLQETPEEDTKQVCFLCGLEAVQQYYGKWYCSDCLDAEKLRRQLEREEREKGEQETKGDVAIFDLVDIYSYAKKVEDFLSRIGGFQMFKAVRIGSDGKNRGSPGNAAMFQKILEETKNVMAICRKGGVKE